jgi:hypothetical protein
VASATSEGPRTQGRRLAGDINQPCPAAGHESWYWIQKRKAEIADTAKVAVGGNESSHSETVACQHRSSRHHQYSCTLAPTPAALHPHPRSLEGGACWDPADWFSGGVAACPSPPQQAREASTQLRPRESGVCSQRASSFIPPLGLACSSGGFPVFSP